MSVHEAGDLTGKLRQMVAVLEQERQALAALDSDALFETSREKKALCDALSESGPEALDSSSRELALTARELNEVNRRVRNLLAANVSTRLEALGNPRHAYAGANASAAQSTPVSAGGSTYTARLR